MIAVTDAIEKVSINPNSFDVEYETIGYLKPKGLCGSAILDVVAEMWKHGVINSRGRFNRTINTPRFKSYDGQSAFVLVSKKDSAMGQEIITTQKDITNIQLAKAAIYTGYSMLMKKKRLKEEDLTKILIAGAFGNYINPVNAKLIGLVPDLPTERIKFVGNTAITGAKMALVYKEVREQTVMLSKRVRYLELSADPDFRLEFASALFLPHRELNRVSSIIENRS